MDATDIKIELLRRGITQAQIARQKGVTPTTVTLVISGRTRSRRVAAAIAKAIDTPLDVVFPEYAKPAAVDCEPQAACS